MIRASSASGKTRAQMFSLSSCSNTRHPPTSATTRPPIIALERQIQLYLSGHLHSCKRKKKVPAQVFLSNWSSLVGNLKKWQTYSSNTSTTTVAWVIHSPTKHLDAVRVTFSSTTRSETLVIYKSKQERVVIWQQTKIHGHLYFIFTVSSQFLCPTWRHSLSKWGL